MNAATSKALTLAEDHADLYRLMKYHSMAILNGKAPESRVISFTSYRAGEGVSTQVTNFALTLSQEPGARVLLVDFNLKKPSLFRFFSNGKENGDAHANHHHKADEPTAPDNELIIRDKELIRASEGLDVIVTRRNGHHTTDPMAEKENIELFLQKAREQYDYILIDSPPLYYNSFAHLLAIEADYTVLVVKAHGVCRHALREEIAQLDRLGANILGVVLNMREYPIPGWIYRLFCGGSK